MKKKMKDSDDFYIENFRKIYFEWPQAVIFLSLFTLSKNVEKSFKCYFCDQCSIGIIMKNFYQILLTPWKIEVLIITRPRVLVFCYQNCSDILWEKNVLVIEKNVWNSRLKAEFAKLLRSLEQCIQTVKGQNNYW